MVSKIPHGLSQLEFPVIAFSPAGWMKEASALEDLTDADPSDSLAEWQGMEIYDSSGRRFTAVRVVRSVPETNLGNAVFRVLGSCIHVGFEFSEPKQVSLEELKGRIARIGELPKGMEWKTHRQLIEFVC